jgi:hypothetical protein
MDLGKGVWLVAANAGEITVAGEVTEDNTYTIDVVEGFNLISNPFPCAISVQNIKCDLTGLDDNGEYQTTMRLWTGNGYTIYGWLDVDDGTNNEVPEWNNSWLLEDMSDLAPAKLRVGEAIWFVAPAAGKVTFTK